MPVDATRRSSIGCADRVRIGARRPERAWHAGRSIANHCSPEREQLHATERFAGFTYDGQDNVATVTRLGGTPDANVSPSGQAPGAQQHLAIATTGYRAMDMDGIVGPHSQLMH